MLRFHSLRIADVQADAEDAVAVAIEVPLALQAEYAGLPGQHVVLRTELAGMEVRRTYSLVNRPGEWPLRIVARVHAQGQMSRHLAQSVRVGDSIDVLPPNGSFTPRVQEGNSGLYVGFAAGCGITPMLSIIKAVLAADPHSQFILFYGNSDTGRMMCLEELLGQKDRYLGRLALHFVMSREPQEVQLYNGRLDAARVRLLAQSLFNPAAAAGYFLCGPGDMIEQVSATLKELQVPAERIHSEHFRATEAGSAPIEPAGTGTPSAAVGAEPVMAGPAADKSQVTVLMDGRRRTFTMGRNSDTILDAAGEAGLELPFSCRAGVCSTCRTKVLSGEVVMAENYALEEWELEQGYILACQSRVVTPTLELDYDEK